MSGIWKKFNPANDLYDQPLAYRGTIAPFGTYTNPDGSESAGFAWPGMITEPLNALQRLHENSYTEDGRLGMPNPQYQGNKDDALTSLLSIYAGNALNHATRLPENAIGMFAGRHAKTADTKAVKAWHSTPAKFDTFDNAYTDEVGFHFGSKNQAHNRAYVESGGDPWTYFTKWRDIPVEMDVKNPANISRDVGQFNGENVARQLVKDSIAPIDLLANVMNQPEAARNAAVRNWLVENGYDAVKYPNRFEGVGDPSYMMLNTGNVRHARTGDTLYSDTGRPSLAGAAVAAENAPTTGITAYHGSPHDFNRFDLSKIGTGEGAQAYGHGLYFAENEGVAKSYRDSLSKAQGINPGRMYQVRINADPNDFLDWDLPLSQQSEKVRDTVLSMVPENDRYPNSLQGKDAVLSLQASQPGKFLDRSEVSPMLREAGIPGIKYLDQMSRAAGDGSRNYVVFDDSLIEILKKYGLAGGVLGASSLFDFNTDQQY